ncbi:porphobilinogen synthase [Dissulfurirhabdus thermomarina]|uniref:Delta-aminolevulinic acid dehydratase n=1 Tax=Dissulfurirhabdus thermomarina TaxID=1765737 RepID=A0A6N9TP73_DISTH|nr:porphobilinogen synthase [Dissulfurirhabdus thermomarina]NDY42969.1 porphobilinogen synthase [Dissulfurirhabdus thermomarina]NMX23952.1 porphobilinogen synthase [Dissulfurirhabdus thermomarina]
MMFPDYRPRRLRRTEALRGLVRETRLHPGHLVYPLFVAPGKGLKAPIDAMPGCHRWSVDTVVDEAKEVADLGVPAVILFGLPEKKDPQGSEAWAKNGVVQKAIRAIKKAVPGLVVITDVCLCEYTSHGHCGVLAKDRVDNDATLELLAKIALSHAQAGADMVAPSDMMDGRVGAIRSRLDDEGFDDVPIMSYAVKYASAFYGPFREAADCAPQFGDRRSYQMDPANAVEALREASLDMEEGADILMVKPAMPYLDIIRLLRQEFTLPVAAYHVSGEYAMIKAAAARGWIDETRVMLESLLSIRRAGADIILTYFAKDAARALA